MVVQMEPAGLVDQVGFNSGTVQGFEHQIGDGCGFGVGLEQLSMLSNIDRAANEIAPNITTAMTNACHVLLCLNTPQSAWSRGPCDALGVGC